MNIFQILRFWSWLVVALELKEEIKCPLCCLLWFSREHNARVHMTFPLNEMYGYSRLCDRLRSSAIIWKHFSLWSSAIRYRLRSFAIIWKPQHWKHLILMVIDRSSARLSQYVVPQAKKLHFHLYWWAKNWWKVRPYCKTDLDWNGHSFSLA